MKKLLLIGILCSLFSGSALSNEIPKGVWRHNLVETVHGQSENNLFVPVRHKFFVEFNQNSFSVTCVELPHQIQFALSINGRNYGFIDLIIDGVTVKNPNNPKSNPSAVISKIQNAKTLQVVYKNGTISVPMGDKKAFKDMSTLCSQKQAYPPDNITSM